MREKHTQRGITLVALIITIVVLLILAVVAIRAVKGEGILDYAKKSASDYEEGKDNEGSVLDHYLGLIDDSQSDLIIHNGVIPEGGVYTCADGTVYNAGQNFPEILTIDDTYEYGDYRYTLNKSEISQQFETLEEVRELIKKEITSSGMTWEEFLAEENITEEQVWEMLGLTEETFYGYWSVKVKDDTKTEYGAILGKINNGLVLSMAYSYEEHGSHSGGGSFSYTAYRGCFEGCESMTKAPKIPSSVTNMKQAFKDCKSLTTAPEIPKGVIDMRGTFYNCKSLTKTPVIPEGVMYIDSDESTYYRSGGCFESCTSLTTAPEIPSSVTDMSYTFKGCTSLVTAPEIPSSVTDMYCTFANCTSLTTAPEIPNGVRNMCGTFYSCTSLIKAPAIPNSVTDIGGRKYSGNGYQWVGGCFEDCTSLKTAPDMSNATNISKMTHAFDGCTSLEGEVEINSNPTDYISCFSLTTTGKNITLKGTSTMLQELANTSTSGYRIVYDSDGNILKQ